MPSIILQTSDDKRVMVDVAVAKQSKLLRDMMQDDDGEEGEGPIIPLAGVTEAQLLKVVEWCTKHVDDPIPFITRPIKSNDIKEVMKASPWDAAFIDIADLTTFFDLILAANYLAVDPLLDLGCARLACILKNKTPKEVCDYFGFPEPTPEEMVAVRKANEWVFDVEPWKEPAVANE